MNKQNYISYGHLSMFRTNTTVEYDEHSKLIDHEQQMNLAGKFHFIITCSQWGLSHKVFTINKKKINLNSVLLVEGGS